MTHAVLEYEVRNSQTAYANVWRSSKDPLDLGFYTNHNMLVNRRILTLNEFTAEQLRDFPQATGELNALLRDISLAAKRVNVEVNKASLVGILGANGGANIQGEEVQKLDVFANNQFTGVLRQGFSCAGIASEELHDVNIFDDEASSRSKYVCIFDSLNGGSNIDINISIGTIFCVYRRLSQPGTPCNLADFMQSGFKIVAAGYIIYGPSTMMIYATRRGVNGFTLDPSVREFILTHPDIKCPIIGNIYSVNQGNFFQYLEPIQQFIEFCQRKDSKKYVPYAHRYTGSIVADMHRTLLKGGVFVHPSIPKYPSGKLRLMYECNPFAFIVEIAGGCAIDGPHRILDKKPWDLHQRSTLFIGSRAVIDELKNIWKNPQSCHFNITRLAKLNEQANGFDFKCHS